MSAYMVAQIEVNDPDEYQKYLAGFLPIFERYGGQLLVTSNIETEVTEGEWAYPIRGRGRASWDVWAAPGWLPAAVVSVPPEDAEHVPAWVGKSRHRAVADSQAEGESRLTGEQQTNWRGAANFGC